MRKTSRSRQFPWSWTSMQSLANREDLVGSSGTPRCWQISAASAGWADPEKTAMSRTGITLEAYDRTPSSDHGWLGDRRGSSEPAPAAKIDPQAAGREDDQHHALHVPPRFGEAGIRQVLSEIAGERGRHGDHRGPGRQLARDVVEHVALLGQVGLQQRLDPVTQVLDLVVGVPG